MKDCQEKASSFLIKLMNMLRSKQNAKTITWDVEESGIRILNQQKLEQSLLPRYFRHNRFTSFVRQLNMYDFHKLYLADNSSVFYHDIFNPRDKESVFRIKRKAPPANDENCDVKSVFKPSLPKIRQKQSGQTHRKKEEIPMKTSFKLLFKNSMRSGHDQQNHTEKALDQIVSHIAPLKLSEQSIRQKIQELRRFSKFKKFLKSSSFLRKIYAKLGIEMDREDDKLSELSIEQQLMFNTKKSLTLRSLKMFESGPINLKDTLGMFLS